MVTRTTSAITRAMRHLGWSGVAALFVLICVLALAAAGPPGDPHVMQLRDRLTPPGGTGRSGTTYLLGTDSLGRDLLSRMIFGCRVSVLVGVLGVSVSFLIGVPLGLLAGYRGSGLDSICSRLADVQLSIPFLLFAIALMASVGTGLVQVILVLGVARWAVFFRIARADVLSIRNEEYVMAAQALGASNLRIVARHILPNSASAMLVAASIGIGDAILAEAGLSYLGLGVPADMPSWGLIAREGKDYLQVAWWTSTLPGLGISTVVLSVSILGDRLRDFASPVARKLLGVR